MLAGMRAVMSFAACRSRSYDCKSFVDHVLRGGGHVTLVISYCFGL